MKGRKHEARSTKHEARSTKHISVNTSRFEFVGDADGHF
jgi:hypothetical protein